MPKSSKGQDLQLRRAVFLDRDGTIVREKGYLCDPAELEWEEGAAEAVGLLNRSGLAAVLVTNQSGIGRGYYTLQQYQAVQDTLERGLEAQGARLDAVYYCPHHPEGIAGPYRQVCKCRKPETGMVDQACASLGIVREGSYLVGDKLADVELARRAGLTGVLVLTGYGRQAWQESVENPAAPQADRVARDLREAVRWILHDAMLEPQKPGPGDARGGRPPLWSCKWGSLAWLARAAEAYRRQGKTIVLANGVFELLHAGHVGYLEAAKALGDVLIVAINDDRGARSLKGPGRPVVPAHERVEILSALACVDHCLVFWDRTVDRVLEAIRPDFHAKGTDYTEETVPERETVLGYGGRVRIVGPPKAHAATDLVARMRQAQG